MGIMDSLTSMAIGGLGAYGQIQKKQGEEYQNTINRASDAGAMEVNDIINLERQKLVEENNLYNQTTNNQISNFDAVRSEYGDEFKDDLDILASQRPDLFLGTDLDAVRQKVGVFMRVPAFQEITREGETYQKYVSEYAGGEPLSASQVWAGQQDANNKKVRQAMVNLTGANATELLLDIKKPVSTKMLEKEQEGRVSRPEFLKQVASYTDSQLKLNPSKVSAADLMRESSWIPTVTVDDILAGLTAEGVTDPQQRWSYVVIKMADTRRALEQQGYDGDARRAMVDNGVITEKNIAAMQDSKFEVVLKLYEQEYNLLMNSPTESGLILRKYNQFGDLSTTNPAEYAKAVQILNELSSNAYRKVRNEGYIDSIGRWTSLLDKDIETQVSTALSVFTPAGEGIINPSIAEGTGMLKLTSPTGIDLGAYSIFMFYPSRDKTGKVQQAEYDSVYGKDAGNEIRKIIENNNGGYNAIQEEYLNQVGLTPRVEAPAAPHTIEIEEEKQTAMTEADIDALKFPPVEIISTKGRGPGTTSTIPNPKYKIWMDENKELWNNSIDLIMDLEPEQYRIVPPKAGKPSKKIITSEWRAWDKKYKKRLELGKI